MKNISKIDKFKNMIGYLSHPYSKYTDKEQPWEYAAEWTEQLRKMGFTIFSPILHTHCFHNAIIKRECKEEDKLERVEISVNEIMDYTEWYLAFIKKFAKGDSYYEYTYSYSDRDCCGYNVTYMSYSGPPIGCSICNHQIRISEKKVKGFDSNIFTLLHKSAYDENKYGGIDAVYESWKEGLISNEDWQSFWSSNGCRLEYEECKKLDIRILDLDEFLNGLVVDV